MEIIKATLEDQFTVLEIVHKTVRDIYPNYYPAEVVDFFIRWHNPEIIHKDISQGLIYIVKDNDQIVATGSRKGKNIERIYVLPDYQGKGYGAAIIEILEREIMNESRFSTLEASLPSYDFYLKRGYKPTEYHRYEVENHRILCYYVMEKELGKPYEKPVIIHDESEESL